MTSIPFEVPPAGTAFFGLLLVFAIGEFGIRVFSAVNSVGRARPERASFFVLVVAIGGALVGSLEIGARLTATAIPFGRWALFVAALIIMAAGIALRTWSVIVLGRSFTVQVRVQEGQRVVDRGPYRVVRHPSYSGLLLVLFGTGLGLGNWLSLIVAVVPAVIATVYRVHVEETALLAGLGEPYRAYLSRVRYRLVPGVW